jgi:hypothetical protein
VRKLGAVAHLPKYITAANDKLPSMMKPGPGESKVIGADPERDGHVKAYMLRGDKLRGQSFTFED